MRACRKYWLMAVSSLNRSLFSCCTTFASPFIRSLRRDARFDAGRAGASRKSRRCAASGCREKRLWSRRVAQQFGGAVAAATAAGAYAELEGKLVERTGTVAHAVPYGLFGDGIADADVQASAPPMRSIIT